MADVKTRPLTAPSFGGKPNPGTKKDKRLKDNAPMKPGGKPFSDGELAQIRAFIDQLTAAPEDAAPEPDESRGTPFTMLLCVEGLETSDSRMFELDSVTWRLPMPFMVRDTATHGPGEIAAPTWAAGQIVDTYRDPDDPTRIMGTGYLMANEAGARAEEIIRQAFRGVSVDAYDDGVLGPDVQPTVVDEDGYPVSVLLRYQAPVITRVTLVPTPAFDCCCVWLDDETVPDIAVSASGADIPRDTEPEVVQVPQNAYEMLVASANSPRLLNPPRDWFFTPEPNHYQPLEVSPDGHVTGHIAPFGQCYLNSGDRCDTAPRSSTVPPYKSFHRTEAHCEDGTRVACGYLTMGTKHERALLSVPTGQAMDHYDHTGTIGAKVRCSDGQYGVWASGGILPGLEDRELAILQGPEVSGDWRKWQDPESLQWYPLEMLGLLAVPVPAYPGARTRPELLVASGGEIIGQFGALDPACDDCDEETPMSAEDIARIDRLQQVTELLLALAPPEVQALARLEPAEIMALASFAADRGGLAVAESDETSEVDLTAPLSPTELGRWYAKYDPETRTAMAADGRARPDGSCAIDDTEDLIFAVRSAGTKPPVSVAKHIERAAERLDAVDLISRG